MDKTVSFTPGPWDAFGRLIGSSESGLVVAEVSIEGCGSGQAEANARLIAAAPKLLQELKIARLWLLETTPEAIRADIDRAISEAEDKE